MVICQEDRLKEYWTIWLSCLPAASISLLGMIYCQQDQEPVIQDQNPIVFD